MDTFCRSLVVESESTREFTVEGYTFINRKAVMTPNLNLKLVQKFRASTMEWVFSTCFEICNPAFGQGKMMCASFNSSWSNLIGKKVE
jgi:hypothetical protein